MGVMCDLLGSDLMEFSVIPNPVVKHRKPHHEKNLLCDERWDCLRNEPDTICKFAPHLAMQFLPINNANNLLTYRRRSSLLPTLLS